MARDPADLNGSGGPGRTPARTLELEGDEESQFLRTEKRVPVRRSPLAQKTQSRLKRGLILCALVLGCGSAAFAAYNYGVHSWRFRLDSSDSIELSGVHNVSRPQVMEVIGADIGRNIFFVPLEERKKQLEQISWVESASVMRLLPNRLAIQIHERTPVAFVRIGSKISLIDSSGVVLGMPANRQAKYSFPIIEGMTESQPLSSRAAAMRIYSRLARELDSDGSHYSRGLSEVDLSDPEDIKITADGAGAPLVVHLGNTDFLERYRLYLTHIAEWRQQFQNLQSVDLRYEGQIIVNPDSGRREALSGAHDSGKASGHPASAQKKKPPPARGQPASGRVRGTAHK